MFNWFKRKRAPKTGPDYRHVDSRAKAEALHTRGELEKIFLLPPLFGGEDVPINTVYVPAFAAALKARLDMNTIADLARDGRVTRYTATPEYEGASVVPSRIHVVAEDPGRFAGTIAIWGDAVQSREAPTASALPAPLPGFNLDAIDPARMEPDTLVRAFMAAHRDWEAYAWQVNERDPNTGGAMEAAQLAYETLSKAFCVPGHRHEPIAFGNKPTHDPARETIVASDRHGDQCVVSTRHDKEIAGLMLTSNYEYHLKKVDGRWFVTSVLYVCDDGKYEGL
jgi:hypothetical protein